MSGWFDEENSTWWDQLAEGLKWQLYVAHRLLDEGLCAYPGNLEVDRRPLIERYGTHRGDDDIMAGFPESLYHLEVKSRAGSRFGFTDGGVGYPFPDAFIGPVGQWKTKQRKGVLPVGVFVVSQETQEMFFVPTFTWRLWTRRMIRDSQRGTQENNMVAPKEAWFTFEQGVNWLKNGIPIVDPDFDAD